MMTLKRQCFRIRDVDYFGMQLVVPNGTRYLTTDKDGCVVAWLDKPYYDSKGVWISSDPYDVRATVARADLNGLNPKNTLVKV